MSTRSFTKIWIHFIWSTHNREQSLIDKEFRKELSSHLKTYSREKGIFLKQNYVNPEHVHALINLPTKISIEETMRLLKGESSHWVNERVNFKFQWGRGYGAFSVSESQISKAVNYIVNQEKHHTKKSFEDEYKEFIK